MPSLKDVSPKMDDSDSQEEWQNHPFKVSGGDSRQLSNWGHVIRVEWMGQHSKPQIMWPFPNSSVFKHHKCFKLIKYPDISKVIILTQAVIFSSCWPMCCCKESHTQWWHSNQNKIKSKRNTKNSKHYQMHSRYTEHHADLVPAEPLKFSRFVSSGPHIWNHRLKSFITLGP